MVISLADFFGKYNGEKRADPARKRCTIREKGKKGHPFSLKNEELSFHEIQTKCIFPDDSLQKAIFIGNILQENAEIQGQIPAFCINMKKQKIFCLHFAAIVL